MTYGKLAHRSLSAEGQNLAVAGRGGWRLDQFLGEWALSSADLDMTCPDRCAEVRFGTCDRRLTPLHKHDQTAEAQRRREQKRGRAKCRPQPQLG